MRKKLSKEVKKQLINVSILVLLVGITLAVLFSCNRELNFENIWSFLKSCNPLFLVAAFASMLLSIIFEGLSLHFILRGLGERPRLLSSMVYSTSDIYYSAITPSGSGGQPASAYYMVKDGIGAGKASFSLVFNLIAYVACILILAAAAFAIRPDFFGKIDNEFVHFLIIAGFIVQGFLLLFFIACMFCGKAVLKCGNGLISLLVRMRILKKPEKWREKLATEVEMYRKSLYELKAHPLLTVVNLLFNFGQRLFHVLVAVFVCLAAKPESNFFDLLALETFVLVGYNSVPLPGGVGVFEYLYLNIYAIAFEDVFILSAMMVTRLIAFYIRMFLSGVYTLGYHIRLMRRQNKEKNGENIHEESGGEEQT